MMYRDFFAWVRTLNDFLNDFGVWRISVPRTEDGVMGWVYLS